MSLADCPLEIGGRHTGRGDPLADLEAAIERAGTYVADLDGPALQDVTEALLRLRRRVESVELAALERYRNSMNWSLDGHRSVNAWLRHRCRLRTGNAGRLVALARKLVGMPKTAAAFAEGRIGLDHVDRLKQANSSERAAAFAEAESLLVANAERMSFKDFATTVEYFEQVTTPEPDPDPDDRDPAGPSREAKKRKLHSTQLMDKMGRIDGWLDPIGWANFDGVLRRIEKELFEADWAVAVDRYGDDVALDKLRRTRRQRRADALVEMASRAAAAPLDGKRPLPLVIIHMDNATFEAALNRAFGVAYDFPTDRRCELQNGTVINPSTAIEQALRGHVRRVVYDTPGIILDYGRSARFATGALRELISMRDRQCSHPSCDVAATQCEADHRVEWQDGGATAEDNLHCACAYHHRVKPSFRITRDPATGKIRWHRRDGPQIE